MSLRQTRGKFVNDGKQQKWCLNGTKSVIVFDKVASMRYIR